MTKRCCIAYCTTNSTECQRRRGGVKNSVFSFPRNGDLKQKWLDQIQLASSRRINLKYFGVCSLHFEKSLIISGIVRETKRKTPLIRPPKPSLEEGAIPTLLLKTEHNRDRVQNKTHITTTTITTKEEPLNNYKEEQVNNYTSEEQVNNYATEEQVNNYTSEEQVNNYATEEQVNNYSEQQDPIETQKCMQTEKIATVEAKIEQPENENCLNSGDIMSCSSYHLQNSEIHHRSACFKCGEIIIDNFGKFTIICCICSRKNISNAIECITFDDFYKFTDHFNQSHNNFNTSQNVFNSGGGGGGGGGGDVDLESQSLKHEIMEAYSLNNPTANNATNSNLDIPVMEPNIVAHENNDNYLSAKGRLEHEGDLTCFNTDTNNTNFEQIDHSEFLVNPVEIFVTADNADKIINKTHWCKLCKIWFSDFNSFHLHNSEVHSLELMLEKIFQCSTCEKLFKSREALAEHVKSIHEKVLPYKCNYCDRAYPKTSALKIHIRTHTGKRTFLCKTCNKKFKSKSALYEHRFAHSAEQKWYSCQYCDKMFDHTNALRKHTEIHTGEKPYICQSCEECFRTLDNLKTHLSTHDGLKPFKCNICSISFLKQKHLSIHYREHHNRRVPNENEILKCVLCGRLLSSKSSLRNHLIQVHDLAREDILLDFYIDKRNGSLPDKDERKEPQSMALDCE